MNAEARDITPEHTVEVLDVVHVIGHREGELDGELSVVIIPCGRCTSEMYVQAERVRVDADAGAEVEVGGGSLTTWVSGGAMAGQMEDDCGFSSAGKEREGMVARGA